MIEKDTRNSSKKWKVSQKVRKNFKTLFIHFNTNPTSQRIEFENEYKWSVRERDKIWNILTFSVMTLSWQSSKFKKKAFDKPIHLRVGILEFSEMNFYESFYVKIQPPNGEGNLTWRIMDTDSFAVSSNIETVLKEIQQKVSFFGFWKLLIYAELVSNSNVKVLGKTYKQKPWNINSQWLCALKQMYMSTTRI